MRGTRPGLLLLAALAACGPPPSVRVTHGGDGGPGSFRAAVEAASRDTAIGSIVFEPGLRAALASPVVYTGTQDLAIDGQGSEIAGAPDAPPAPTWDAGLFASHSAASLVLRDLRFRDSFNNGVGVFVPEDATGVVSVALERVAIEGSRFHGLLVDGQLDEKYNTDDVPHPLCTDPWGVDSAAGIELSVSEGAITGNGTLRGGFDTGEPTRSGGKPALSGCPADFDGIRVDEGGPGGIHGRIERSRIEGNRADGVEYDERGPGDVRSRVADSSIERNGETGTADLDDGFDIDEADPGSLEAHFEGTRVLDNRDEGIDLDEADAGSVRVTLVSVTASRNQDQGLKVDEEGPGDLRLTLTDSSASDSRSQHGIELTEEDEGSLDARLAHAVASGNDGAALAAEQEPPGAGRVTATASDLAGNAAPSLELRGVEPDLEETRVDPPAPGSS